MQSNTTNRAQHKKREPLFHIIKRTQVPSWQKWLIRLGALVVGLIIAYIFLLIAVKGDVADLGAKIARYSKSDTVKNNYRLGQIENDYLLTYDASGALTGARISFIGFWKNLFEGGLGFGAARYQNGAYHTNWAVIGDRTMDTLRETSILLMVGLALLPAFKMKFWNLGGDGQILMGNFAAVLWMFYLSKNPYFDDKTWLVILLMIISGVVAGMIWAVIPAIFKAFFNTNESLFTLMMNYVASALVSAFLASLPSNTHTMGMIEKHHFAEVAGNKYLLPILICMVVFVLLFFYLKISRHGYELEVVGESQNTARYVGINVKKVVIRTMVLSGAICGLVGVLLAGSVNFSINANSSAGRGFTAIMVTWLGQFNPFFMILTAFLVAFISNGMTYGINTTYGLTNSAFGNISLGVIYFFIIACEFFISYAIVRTNKINKKKTPVLEAPVTATASNSTEPKEAETALPEEEIAVEEEEIVAEEEGGEEK